jgi:hypothetical protein
LPLPEFSVFSRGPRRFQGCRPAGRGKRLPWRFREVRVDQIGVFLLADVHPEARKALAIDGRGLKEIVKEIVKHKTAAEWDQACHTNNSFFDVLLFCWHSI